MSFICRVYMCGRAFTTEHERSLHETCVPNSDATPFPGRVWICDLQGCQARFANPYARKAHRLTCTPKATPAVALPEPRTPQFHCPQTRCDALFDTLEQRALHESRCLAHLDRHPSQGGNWACTTLGCPSTFATPMARDAHRRRCNFICQECQMSFELEWSLHR